MNEIAQHIIDGILTDMPALGAADLLESEIERRGLQDRYAFAVLAQKETSDYLEGDHWFLLRATPEQRARAFMQVVDVQS